MCIVNEKGFGGQRALSVGGRSDRGMWVMERKGEVYFVSGEMT